MFLNGWMFLKFFLTDWGVEIPIKLTEYHPGVSLGGGQSPRWGGFFRFPPRPKKIHFRSPPPGCRGGCRRGILGGTFWTIFATVWVFLAPQARFLANIDHFLAFRRHFKGIWRHFFSNLKNFLENIYYFRSTPQKPSGGTKNSFLSPPKKIPPSEKFPPPSINRFLFINYGFCKCFIQNFHTPALENLSQNIKIFELMY